MKQGNAATIDRGGVLWTGTIEAIERYPSGSLIVHVCGGTPKWRLSIRSKRGGPWQEVWWKQDTRRYSTIGPVRLEVLARDYDVFVDDADERGSEG
jgi:hypothetical protein